MMFYIYSTGTTNNEEVKVNKTRVKSICHDKGGNDIMSVSEIKKKHLTPVLLPFLFQNCSGRK